MRATELPARCEQILNIAEAEMKAVVQPNGVSDHLGWEAMATVGRRGDSGATGHGVSIPAAQLDNPPALLELVQRRW